MSKVIKLTERDLNILVKKVLKEQEEVNYMFFSNLKQIKRQCEIMLEMDPNEIDNIIGRNVIRDISYGEPVKWSDLDI